jgi:hypothetical protein
VATATISSGIFHRYLGHVRLVVPGNELQSGMMELIDDIQRGRKWINHETAWKPSYNPYGSWPANQ